LVKVGKILNLIQKWFFASSGMLCLWGPTGGGGGGAPLATPSHTGQCNSASAIWRESWNDISKSDIFFHFILSKVLCVVMYG